MRSAKRVNKDDLSNITALIKQNSQEDTTSIQQPINLVQKQRQHDQAKINNKSNLKNEFNEKKEVSSNAIQNNENRQSQQINFKGSATLSKGSKQKIQSTQKIVQTYDFASHNVEVQNDGRLVFQDIREDILTKKVDKALFKVQQIDNQKYALKLLVLKHFLINIARFTHSYMNKHITKFQKTVIRDLALPENNTSTYNSSNQRNIGNRDEEDQKLGIVEKIIYSIPLFYPSNTFLVLWDISQLIFILLFFYAIPLQIVFNLGLGKFISDFVFNAGMILFVIDNMFCINTTYFEKGVPVKDRQLIWQHYLKKHFITDFLSNIPVLIDYFITNLKGIWGLIMLMQYLKVDRITIIIRKVEERFHLSPQQQQLVLLLKLLFRVLFVAHIFACIWLYLALSNQDDTDVWLNKFDYNKKSWSEQYLVSYYFTTVTMITVGYGDFAPLNNREFAFCIFTMLIACGVFAYAVNQIGSIFENIGRQEQEMKEMMYSISSYMHLKKVSKELQYQIREYLQYYWREQQDRDTDIEEKIKNQLSDNLKDMLALEANNIVLKDSVVFKNNFSNQIISKTVPLIKEYRATPEEIILYENTVTEDQNIYFIEKGQVEVFLGQSDQPIQVKKLNAGDCFGQVGFFTGQSRILSVRSLDFTTLVYIKRAEFIDLLKEFPEDYEQFCYIRDKIIIESDYRLIGMKCYSCRDGKHLSHDCPFLHFTPKKFLLLKKYFYPGFQNRDEQFKRKKINKAINCLKGQEELKEKAEEIQEQYSMIIDDLFGDDDFYSSEEKQENEDENEDDGTRDEDNSVVKVPSYLLAGNIPLQKGLSIDKFVENNQKLDESQSEDSNFVGSAKKIQLFPNQRLSQQGFQGDIRLEDITNNIQKEKNQTSIIQIPKQISMNIINDYRIQELTNNTDSDNYVQSEQNLILKPHTLFHQKEQKEGRLKTGPTKHRFSGQRIASTTAIKDALNSPLLQTFSHQQITQHSINLSQHQVQNTSPHKFENSKSIINISRSDSRKKSTKKKIFSKGLIAKIQKAAQFISGVKGIREDTNISKQLSSQTSKLETLHKQHSKQKIPRMASTLGKNIESKQTNLSLIDNHNIRNSSLDINQALILQKISELLGINQDSQKKADNSQFMVEDLDNQNNFSRIEDFDVFKNFLFYYPQSNVEFVLDRILTSQNKKQLRKNSNFIQLAKTKTNGPTLQNPTVELLRKQRKTGGTRIIAGGGVTEEMSQSQDADNLSNSQGINNLGEGSPFARNTGRKMSKRMNIVSGFRNSISIEPPELPKENENDQSKLNVAKKSKFQPNSIEEDEEENHGRNKSISSESTEQEKSTARKTERDQFFNQHQQEDVSKFSTRNNIIEDQSKHNFLEKEVKDSHYDFKGSTFSKIPSQQSIDDNGNLPSFKNFQKTSRKNLITKNFAM